RPSGSLPHSRLCCTPSRPQIWRSGAHDMADVIDTSEFRNGLKILIDNEPFVIVEFQHVKPGKGSAFVRTRYKSLISGRVRETNFKSGEKVGRPDIEEKKIDRKSVV